MTELSNLSFDSDRHAVYAYLSTAVKVRVSPWLSWDGAQRYFAGIDQYGPTWQERRDAGITVGDYIGHVQHFAVRQLGDPTWPRQQPPHTVRGL